VECGDHRVDGQGLIGVKGHTPRVAHELDKARASV
jgi:hypothetical protein